MWQDWRVVVPATSDYYPILHAIDSKISSLEPVEKMAAEAFNLASPLNFPVLISKCQESLSGLGYDQLSARGVLDWLLKNSPPKTISPELVHFWTEYTQVIDELFRCHDGHLSLLLNATTHYVSPSESSAATLLDERRRRLRQQISSLFHASADESQRHDLQRAWQEFNTVVSEKERIFALDGLHCLRKQLNHIFTSMLPDKDPEVESPWAPINEVFVSVHHIHSP